MPVITAEGKQQYSNTVVMVTEECCTCGILFGVAVGFKNARRNDQKAFYCPNGHAQSYKEEASDKAQLRRQLAQKETELAQARAAASDHMINRIKAEAETSKANRELKRVKKRIENGVCPCCNRHFVNLERHMKNKHPERG